MPLERGGAARKETRCFPEPILQGIPDQEQPGAIVARLMEAVPAGNYLAISQIASDVAATEVAEGVQHFN